MVGAKSLVPGLWSVTGNLPSLANPPLPVNPKKPIEAVRMIDIDNQTGIVGIGDLY